MCLCHVVLPWNQLIMAKMWAKIKLSSYKFCMSGILSQQQESSTIWHWHSPSKRLSKCLHISESSLAHDMILSVMGPCSEWGSIWLPKLGFKDHEASLFLPQDLWGQQDPWVIWGELEHLSDVQQLSDYSQVKESRQNQSYICVVLSHQVWKVLCSTDN